MFLLPNGVVSFTQEESVRLYQRPGRGTRLRLSYRVPLW